MCLRVKIRVLKRFLSKMKSASPQRQHPITAKLNPPPQMRPIHLESRWKAIWLDGCGGCHCASSRGWVSRLCAAVFTPQNRRDARIQWADGIEVAEAEIKAGCWLTKGGGGGLWLKASPQHSHGAGLICCFRGDSDRVRYQCRQAA